MAQSSYERIMQNLTAKTAADNSVVTEKVAAAEEPEVSALDKALDEVRSAPAAEKVAETDKVAAAEDLSVMAKHAAEAELENMVKQANLMGQHVADGFMQRMAVYQNQFEAGEKVAHEKIAAEIQQGEEDTTAFIYKTAADLHFQGQQIADELIKALRDS